MTTDKAGLLTFLQEQTRHTRHSRRSLYDHLVGTHDLLRAWEREDDICHAGLFHSIYGTRRFNPKSWPFDQREAIVTLIGPKAEQLAYTFCVIDRPRCLVEDPRDRDGNLLTYDFHADSKLLIPPETLTELLEIEAANLLEQRSRSRILERLLRENISEAARSAISEVMS